jgi:hypothetical protein
MSGVVVGISRPDKAVIRHFVPFFARDLARFATNAYSRIGEEADFDVFLDVIVPPLVGAVCAFADHKIWSSSSTIPGALILSLPWRDRLRLYLRRAAVPRDVERAGLFAGRICSGTRRMRVHAANALAQCCKCKPWLP